MSETRLERPVEHIGRTPSLTLPIGDEAPALGRWVGRQYAQAGLDPDRVLAEIPFIAAPGQAAMFSTRILDDLADPSEPRSVVMVGEDFIEMARTGAVDAEAGLRQLVGIGGHEAGHALVDSVRENRGQISMRNEAGTVAEHGADVLGWSATGVMTNRHDVPRRSGAPAWPRSASEYVTTWLDRGGIHTNVAFLDDAVLSAARHIDRHDIGALYRDALASAPKRVRIAVFAAGTVASAERLFGSNSPQAQAMVDAWHGVGLNQALLAEGGALRRPRELPAAWFRDFSYASATGRAKLVAAVTLPVFGAGALAGLGALFVAVAQSPE